MSIEDVWCKETQSWINIIDAHNIFFGKTNDFPDLKGKRLTFYCHTTACKQMKNPPIITGRNYDEEFINKGKPEPHFALRYPEKHAPLCTNINPQLRLKKNIPDDINIIDSERPINQTTLEQTISVFKQQKNSQIPKGVAQPGQDSSSPTSSGTQRLTTNTPKQTTKKRISETELLHKLVSQYEGLSTEEARMQTPLQLGEGSMVQNYQTCFRPYSEYILGSDNHVFHGEITIEEKTYIQKKFGEEIKDTEGNPIMGKGIAIKFKKPTTIKGQRYYGSFFISDIQIQNYPHRNPLITLIEKAIRDKVSTYCYFFGSSILKKVTIPAKDDKEAFDIKCLNIKINHLSDLALRERAP